MTRIDTTPEAPLALHPDRALPAEPGVRAIAREILAHTEPLPIVSMHGHVDISVFVDDAPFPDPAALLIRPDHYLTRMLGSQGISREELLGEPGRPVEARRTWRSFCENWRLFRGTPTRYWLEDVLAADYLEELERLQMPTLILHGAKDLLVPLSDARDVASRIPDSRLEVLREASHLPYMSHPNAFTALLGDFLSQHAS